MTVFASFVNKLKKQLKFPALQGVGSNRSKYRDFTSRSLFLSIKLHNWSCFNYESTNTKMRLNLNAYLARYSFIICSCTARFFAEAWWNKGVLWNNRENGQCFKNRGCMVLKHCRVSGVSTWFVQNWQSGIFYSPPARAHVVEKSGCPCPGWSRSKLAG